MIDEEGGFPAVGGRVALDFVATLGKRDSDRIERLRVPGDLERWARHAGIADRVADADETALERARDLREAIHRLVLVQLNGAPTGASDVAVVNAWAGLDAPSGVLVAVEGGFRREPPSTTADGLLAAVARDAVDLLAGPDLLAVRECEGERCTLLFVDTSRGSRRRWCSMDACGARSKMRALRARHHS